MHRIFITTIILLSIYIPAYPNVVEYKVKAAFIEKFTRFIEWPQSVSGKSPDNFVIGVLGDTPITTYLNQLAKKRRIKGKNVLVKVITDFNQINRCHILFISRRNKNQVGFIVNRTRNKSILTISESRGSAKRGVLINFFLHKNYVRFEINDLAVKHSKLKFSSKLLRLAKIVH